MQDDIQNYFTPGTDPTTVTSSADATGSFPQRAYRSEYNGLGIKTNLVIPLTTTTSGNNAGIKNVVGDSSTQTTQSPVSANGNVQSSTQIGFESGTGWWMGYDQGIPKFYVGNYPTRYIAWDGTTFFIQGDFVVGNTITLVPGDSIQAALTTLSTSGGIVNLQAGTYNETANIVIPSGVSLKGSGVSNTIIDFGSTAYGIVAKGTVLNPPGPGYGIVPITGITMSDFTVQHSHAAAAIDIDAAQSITLNQLQIQNNLYIGLRIQHSWLISCNNVYLYLNGTDDFYYYTDANQSAQSIFLSNILSWAPGGYGFNISGRGGNGNMLLNCVSVQSTTEGIHIVDNGSGTTFYGTLIGCASDNSITKPAGFTSAP